MMLLTRAAAAVHRLGEEFTVGGSTFRGVFRVLDSGTLRTYLNDTEIMGVTNPGLLLITAPSSAVSVNDTITRDGRTYTALRSVLHRLAGVPVVRVVVLA